MDKFSFEIFMYIAFCLMILVGLLTGDNAMVGTGSVALYFWLFLSVIEVALQIKKSSRTHK